MSLMSSSTTTYRSMVPSVNTVKGLRHTLPLVKQHAMNTTNHNHLINRQFNKAAYAALNNNIPRQPLATVTGDII
ncbi:hypothetical protein SAMN04488136_11619 [Vibrio xiamenensis]|uniref:Uncharacterized protein n=1 Tax=Vibrio xiamenensis TaxID=861298 RepID=A0A1G8CED9_9VIBR|nr:hypothetical protein SAMN04488136_11619 [Vibrio xiamenensis]